MTDCYDDDDRGYDVYDDINDDDCYDDRDDDRGYDVYDDIIDDDCYDDRDDDRGYDVYDDIRMTMTATTIETTIEDMMSTTI